MSLRSQIVSPTPGYLAAPFVIMTLVAGCQTGGNVQSTASANVKHLTLTNEQVAAVQGGVKQIVSNPQTAQFSNTTAISAAGEPGIHVCGYVKVAGEAGNSADALPFYLELRERGGKPIPERGQVGNDTSKRSKVNFMCRRNGNI